MLGVQKTVSSAMAAFWRSVLCSSAKSELFRSVLCHSALLYLVQKTYNTCACLTWQNTNTFLMCFCLSSICWSWNKGRWLQQGRISIRYLFTWITWEQPNKSTTIEAARCCASATKPNYRFPDSENQIPIRWRYTSTSGTHDAPAACSSSLWLYYSASSPLPASPLHYCLIIILAAGAGGSNGTRFWKALRWNRILMDCLLHGHLERSP